MVKEITKQGTLYFMCEECEFIYNETKWAAACEEHCRTKKSCSLDITQHSLGSKEEFQ
jgi:hypothetical protein